MASIYFQSHEIAIYRQRRIGATNRYAMSATLTAYKADIQPAGVERIQLADGRFGSVWQAFIDPSVNLKEGDQVVANGKRYSVQGITKWDGAGLLSHQELTLISQDGN